jgi:hypothetical protein
MLSPAEEIGLSGLRLANRVQQALDAIPPAEMANLLRALHQLATERHLVYQHAGVTETVRVLPCPLTLRPDQLGYTHYVSETILNSLKRLPDLYLNVPRVREILQLTPIEDEWLRECWTPAHREANPVFSRLDAVVDYTTAMWKDSFQFLEPNLTGIGGLHLAPTTDHLFADLVLPALLKQDPRIRLQVVTDVRQLLLQDLLEHLETIGRPGGQLVLVDPKYEAEGPDEPDALAQYYREHHGISVLHADPSELHMRGDEVYFGDSRVDVAYRDYSVLELAELATEGVDITPMRTLFRQNRVVSSLTADFDQKSCWEIFTDPELADRFLSVEERQVMRRHVLWTRILADRATDTAAGERVDLLEYTRRERESLVLKPNRSYGGTGVLVGALSTQADWEAAIQSALTDADRWVVQRRTQIPVKSFHVLDDAGGLRLEPFYVVMGFAPSRYGVALIARASQRYVVNVAQHGGICPVMVSAVALRGPTPVAEVPSSFGGTAG